MDYTKYTVEDFVADASFIRWVKGSDSQAQAFWTEWQQKHPEKSDQIKEARQLVVLLYSLSKDSVTEPTKQELRATKKQIFQQLSNHTPSKAPSKTRSISRYRALAAVILLIVVSTFVYWWYQSAYHRESYQTTYGEVKTIILPDQTSVTLNGNSVLETYTAWENEAPREVWLTGEAYFDVTHRAKPESSRFIVHSNELDIEVLGTQFNVHNRRGATEVVLAEGKVKLTPTNDQSIKNSEYMQPGELVSFLDGRLNRQKVDTEKHTAWRNFRLYFESAPLSQIAQRLEDTYGLRIDFSHPELAKLTFTGSCPANNLSVLFTALSEALDLSVNQQGNAILIRSNEP